MRFPRLDFAGARHHVMNRGARRERIFLDDESRARFLDVLSEFPARFGVRVHGFALMPNHYHLMLELVTGDLPRAMRHLGGSYSQRLNRLHSWDGPLFRGRYHNRLVGTEAYWRHLLVYLHLNPERAGFAEADAIHWTSHGACLGLTPPPVWLETNELQGVFGSRVAYLAYYNRIRGGQEEPPDDFDGAKLWAPNSRVGDRAAAV